LKFVLFSGLSGIRPSEIKLVRFAHNWNVGTLEYWNHGFWDNGIVGLKNQNEYNCIDFLIIVAYFLGQKQKMDV
jgi:hypothetical protein